MRTKKRERGSSMEERGQMCDTLDTLMQPFLGVRKKAWRHLWRVVDKDTEPWHQHRHTHGNDKRELAQSLFLSWPSHYLNYGKCTFVSPYAILQSFLGAKISLFVSWRTHGPRAHFKNQFTYVALEHGMDLEITTVKCGFNNDWMNRSQNQY